MSQKGLHLQRAVQIDMGHDPQRRIPLRARRQHLDQVGLASATCAGMNPIPAPARIAASRAAGSVAR